MRKSKSIFVIAAILITVAMLIGCSSSEKPKQEAGETPGAGMPKAPRFHGNVAGVSWSFPNTWTVAPEKPMRSATYIVQPVSGDSDSAECAIYYFGSSSGGGKQANLERWASQFEQSDGKPSMEHAIMKEESVNGLPVSTIDLKGAYLVASGPMMQVSGKKEGYRLLGAIVEGPQGSIFFKMTGPEKTMTATESDFREMVASLQAQSL